MSTWILVLLIACLALFIIYVIGSIGSRGSIIRSIWKNKPGEIKADQVYYLPTASLLIKTTAKVIVSKNAATGNITDSKLAELAFDITVQIVPDTRYVFGLTYIPSSFANDDLKFSINSSGLLEGINLTAEDRISTIVNQVTDAPKIILSGEQAAERMSIISKRKTSEGVTVIIETKEYSNTFLILTKEIRKRSAHRVWKINVDGTADTNTTVDASFTLKFDVPRPESYSFNDGTTEFDGILTRPLQTIIMGIYRSSNSAEADVNYQIIVPDESSIVSIPVKRSAFVKKVYAFKMINGILTENTLNKPSEMEGFISIPIKIAKAIVSVPAQLLSFKIENIKRAVTKETEQQNLAKAELQMKKNEIVKEGELLKARLDNQKNMLTYEGEIAKTKLEAEKTLLNAQREVITASKDLTAAKKDWENAKKELEELLKKNHEGNADKYKPGKSKTIDN